LRCTGAVASGKVGQKCETKIGRSLLSRYDVAANSVKVIAIDTAGYIHTTDLGSLWGNTLKPIKLLAISSNFRRQ
jgi:hypothetical protein